MQRPGKILLVKDISTDSSAIRALLPENFILYETRDVMDTFLFLQRNPDTMLVLIDIDTPTPDSMDPLVHVRFSPWMFDIPVVLMSGDCSSETRLHAMKLGATDFITKPVAPETFRQILTHLLSEERRQRHSSDHFSRQMYALSQSVHCGISIYEVKNSGAIHILFSNKAFAEICGYTPEEFGDLLKTGTLLDRILYPDDQILFQQSVKAMLTRRRPIGQSMRIRRKDGTVHYLSFNAKVYHEFNDSTIFHMVALDLPDDVRLKQPFLDRSILHKALGNAAFDRLTDIYTKETFFKQTRQMLDEHPCDPYVMILLKINHYRTITDLFGIHAGDSILVQTASALRRTLLGMGTFGRLFMDIFAACIPRRLFNAGKMLKLETTVCSSFDINYNIALHNGLYVIDDPSLSISEMCDRAMIALSSIPDHAVMQYAYYSDQMHKTILTQQQLLSDIPKALAEHQFVIHLQPIYSLHFKKPVGAEVLVRWQHPIYGLLPPGKFIPLFEKNFCIAELDQHIWNMACQYLASRRERGLPMLPVSVNMSRVTLGSPSLLKHLCTLLDKYRLSPALLRLEITESAYMENPQQLIDTTRRLQSHGFKILIDDFGNGYSSLNLLKDIPADVLKIDRQFMMSLDSSPRAAALLLGIIRIAEQLNMVTIAEGVETEFQLNFLRSTGCDNIQGFYYAKPVPIDDFEDFLEISPTI